MRAARGATSSATKWRTRPTSSACSALRPSSPRVVIGPASTQLHLYLPCRFPQEWDDPFEFLHRVPERQGDPPVPREGAAPCPAPRRRISCPPSNRVPLRQELEDVLCHGAHLAALVGDFDICACPQVLLVDLGDGVSNRDRITDKDRPCKPDAVVAQRDGLRPRLLDHERRGRRGEAYGKHAVGDALLVWRPFHDLFVHVVWAEVARDTGKQVHVGLADGLAERNRVTDFQGYGLVPPLLCVSAPLHVLLLPTLGLRSPQARSPARRVSLPYVRQVRGAGCAAAAPPHRSGRGGRAPAPSPPS